MLKHPAPHRRETRKIIARFHAVDSDPSFFGRRLENREVESADTDVRSRTLANRVNAVDTKRIRADVRDHHNVALDGNNVTGLQVRRLRERRVIKTRKAVFLRLGQHRRRNTIHERRLECRGFFEF